MASTWFVDLAAVRIQTWLARSARIRYRRGASFRLADLTTANHLTTLLPPGGLVVPNPEAGNVSGVASLCFPAAGLTDDQAREIALNAALAVAQHLRSVFPALPLQALWGRGDFYVQAYAGDMRKRAPLLDLPALVQEGIASRPCGMCRTARAVHAGVSFVKEGDDEVDVCVDCYSRVLRGDKAKSSVAGAVSASKPSRLPEAQQRLHADLAKVTGEGSVFPDDFGDLARWVPKAQGDAATQLCTIYADGNRIGALMKVVADHLTGAAAQDPTAKEQRQTIVAGITEATRRSVAEAAAATMTGAVKQSGATDAAAGARVPALVHLADGDDVLMTVPAAVGWQAARKLGSTFASELRQTVSGAGIAEELQDFSLSMGMVFHHASHPFADVVVLAEDLLVSAKRQVKGLQASVAFLDITADGETSIGAREANPDQPRRALTLDELDTWEAALTEAAAVEASQRANVLQLLREVTAEANSGSGVAPGDEQESARGALARRVATMGERGILALVSESSESTEQPGQVPEGRAEFVAWVKAIRARLESDDPGTRDELRLRLDIARWWPAPAVSAPQPDGASPLPDDRPSEGDPS